MSTTTKRTSSLEEPSPLLPADPAARAARWTAWLLLGVASGAVAVVCLLKLPEVVSASFVLEPESGADPIQAPLAGEVAAVRVHDGQEVKTGDELFTLRSDEIRNWQARLGQLQEDARALAQRAGKLEEAHAAELAIKDAEIAQTGREIQFRQRYFDTSQEFLRRSWFLAIDGLVSEIEFLRDELRTAEAEKDLAVGDKSKQQLMLQRQELQTARGRERIEEAALAEKLKIQIRALEQQLGDCMGEVKKVKAPYDAVVLSLKQRNVGSVVATGAELCQLAPASARPVARLTLPPSGLPRLRAGQQVRLRYDAYPYQRYGSLDAELTWISPATVVGPNGPTFQATGELQPVPGVSLIRPKVGMRGEARILVGRRTILDKVLEPLRMLRERAITG
jgi:multidrug efflux pump subunit AcrA (membrane-fusion protein)